jgi:mono/diheme cytochrome c family protein
MRALAVAVVATILTAGCGDPTPPASLQGVVPAAHTAAKPWDPADRAAALTAGAQVIHQHQCTRCHVVDALPRHDRALDCVSCHVFMKGLTPDDKRYQSMVAKYGAPIIDRYIANIDHLRVVPDLTGVARRVRPRWIQTFLAEPFDVRPMLEESMFRNNLTADERRAVARYFAAAAEMPDPDGEPQDPPAHGKADHARLARGRDKFISSTCAGCHTVGNERFPSVSKETLAALGPAAKLAPNLRFVRERVRPDALVEWIMDPKKLNPATLMPTLGLSREDAQLIADYLLSVEHELAAPVAEADTLVMPPAAQDPVTWEIVREKVLGKVCVHCHMNDHEKDTGPGNQGGLGYTGKGLAFRTYDMAMRGAQNPDGTRYSVFAALPYERWPRILQTMVNRRSENRRDLLPPYADRERPSMKHELLGMPMGLPAMTDVEIGLLRRWIEDGCPGPTQPHGMAGVTDGYLVPDGPSAVKNRGCEVRSPDVAGR